ncbi:phosphatase PAP2 family protein [Rhizobium laguerreae]|uniref:phosphatase PAP2 family protein n=1 Tax=Rhizobium TaxID=379 RepID=UPI0013DA7012|nr:MULTISPECIES: phosphatase PAP2 family protein [Rhizobium]MBY3243452.1 phosphatase PAP2 family protein [Rhizobium laguerreae]MBY3526768.1 phosphatase PAP2 family protein [Rhizobium laguerreae]NEK34259.1 phosphatase PAP2 family protein [Rhizobium leguminosarum]
MSVAGAGLVALLVKNVVGRARPELIESAGVYSFRLFAFDHEFAAFPSGHSATAGAMAMSPALAFPSIRLFVISIGVLICMLRLMLGEHWASDTLMGWPIGVAFASWLAHVFARRGLVFRYGSDGKLYPELHAADIEILVPVKQGNRDDQRCSRANPDSGQ